MEDAYEDSSVASAWAERSGETRPSGGNRIHPHAEKEQRRREEERHRELRIGKEQQIHRDKTARQVMKGVAKLVELQASRDVYLSKHVSVEQLSKAFGVRLERLQAALRKAGLEEVSYDHLLDSEDAALIAPEFGCNVVIDEAAAFDIYPPPLPADLSTLPHRPPVVTIMGHVDHGKTTLLDTLRSASVAQGEAGGITQHIGAFSLPVSSLSTSKKAGNKDERMITFLDTPGHAAFSAMRARGAMVTDVIILVVAADDGVMPQTKEVINLVKKEQGRVGLVVAINKIDKPGADPMTVKQMLLAEGVQLEEFGGDVPAVEVSGLTGQGLDTLMETTSLVSELMDIRAEQKGTSVGYVLESKIVKGFGPVATVLLLRGEMNAGSHLIAGQTQCRVRTLTDSNGKTMKKVTPGTAVSIAGWKELPNAGDEVIEASENDIKRAITNRKRNAEMASLVEDVSAINEKRRLEREKREQELEAAKEALESGKTLPIKPVDRPEMKTSEAGPEVLRLIIKADVSGSAEAVAGALEGIGNDKATTKIIQYGVGSVTESDITMAKATGASIIAFGVQCPRTITQLALSQHVPVIASDIIYRLMETVREKVAGLLPPIIEHKVTGEANVQQMFEIDLKGRKTLKVAGCRVVNGTLEKNKSMRLVRNGEIIHDGTLETFRHLKKDITEARKGMECGLSLSKFTGDFLPGDAIQMYETITKPAIL
ncbi:initiation factor 2 [Serendipita vermifera]|nr:initiation factor 2 [Serendipita vermifera]